MSLMQKYKKTIVTEHFAIKATKANVEKLYRWVSVDEDLIHVLIDVQSRKEPISLSISIGSYLVFDRDPLMYSGLIPDVYKDVEFKRLFKKVR